MRNVDRYIEPAEVIRDDFEPTTGQTIFVLSFTPIADDTVEFRVNGIAATLNLNFTVSGATITWLDTPHTLDEFDTVEVRYIVRT